MEFRELVLEDFDKYNVIRKNALDGFPEAFSSSDEEEIYYRKEKFINIINSDYNFILGAFDKDKLVGIITFFREEKKKLKHKGNIFGMFVIPEKQGLKIGEKLLELAVDKAFYFKGLRQILLSVVEGNEKAYKLYEKYGFKVFGIEKDSVFINGKYLDEIFMIKFK